MITERERKVINTAIDFAEQHQTGIYNEVGKHLKLSYIPFRDEFNDAINERLNELDNE